MIAMKQHRCADADCDAIDRGDQWLLTARQRVQELVCTRVEPA